MRVELINTGSELLLGFTVNSHLNDIARKLFDIGLRLNRQTTVGDDRAEMRAIIAEALQRSDVIIITGGLGPTSDDFTRDVVAELLDRKLVRDDAVAAHIAERMRKRGIKLPDSVYVQALVPEGAQVLPNANGTAPGLFLEITPHPSFRLRSSGYGEQVGHPLPSVTEGRGMGEGSGKLIFLLPGPPRELKPMFENHVLPLIQKHIGAQAKPDCRVFKVVGLAESLVEEKVAPVLADLSRIDLGYCAKMGEVEVRILSNLESVADEAERRIRTALGDHVFGMGEDRLEEVVVGKLIAARKTIAVAESCTGGLIANRITNVSGSSEVFINGLVAYSNESKVRLLGVSEATLEQHGAVSEEVAREMAESVRARSKTDLALSTTGIAGPAGGTPEKPVGLVYIGFATSKETVVQRHMLLFNRETFKFFASQYALDMVRRELLPASAVSTQRRLSEG
ncbi:MAG: nicotinamide-nucleotide amidohydrolase family protein [Verrucomicrobiia bacterium]